jgi:hypothetical protein
VEIDADGWRVIDTPPVRFRRAAGMLPLPIPVAGGSVDELRPFLNVRTDNEFSLAVSWVLAALRDRGPYPVLALFGEHGTAKTTFANILRSLIDPSTLPLRTLPRDDRDLFIAAVNGPPWPTGSPTRCAGCRPAAASPRGSSTPTRTRCCSMRSGR